MKSSHPAAIAAAMIATCLLAPSLVKAGQSSSPSIPIGSLSASANVVKAGSCPTLTWSITYPSVVKDYITVIDPATISPKQSLDYEVRVLGAGVTVSNADGSDLTFVPTEAQISVGGASYKRVFYGTNNDVNPAAVVSSGTVKSNQTLCFGGRYYYNRAWGPYYNSQSGTNNIRALVNGQVPPTGFPVPNAPTLESFIKPYLDASGKVMIGPMDVIVLMELTHTDAQMNEAGYDLQDMVLLVTFKTKN